MDCTWEKDGLLFGSLSEEDREKGGKWMIGDLFSSDHPGYSQVVKYKSWVARRDKYGKGAYPFKDRAESGLWEYVMTMRGRLVALERNPDREGENTRSIVHHGEIAEYPPVALRSWELPADCDEASGITVLWSGNGMRTGQEISNPWLGFRCEFWKGRNAQSQLNPRVQAGFDNLRVVYVDVFGGKLSCYYQGEECLQLQAGSYVYIKAGTHVRFELAYGISYGTILYYQ